MPKIVDHDQYRERIIDRAVVAFRRHGYSGIGMRRLATELGMSKSALYHYFPSKDALFIACSHRVAAVSLDTDEPPAVALTDLARDWEAVFAGELRILLDYIGERNPESVRNDPAARAVRDGLGAAVATVVPAAQVVSALSAVAGFLLLRYLDGRATPFSELTAALERLLE